MVFWWNAAWRVTFTVVGDKLLDYAAGLCVKTGDQRSLLRGWRVAKPTPGEPMLIYVVFFIWAEYFHDKLINNGYQW